ncbi:MAG TPA: MlaD family protein [Alphaproteobacteria bacterium]|jgi:phospholipid/cholesterol/gamma-HCH transport system substrate-binding protein|nr:MlaD family protein [Alphaproteobacteria bacterium]
METRANHMLIGAFVLLVVAGIFGFVIWLAKIEIDREFSYYHIYFEGSVSGLNKAGEVRYKGIPVGSVKEIVIDPQNPNRVRVRIEVAANTPVREDSEATLELQGITGVSYVQLSGGDPKSPKLKRKKGEALPIIASRPSQFEELFAGAPELINRVILLVGEATKIFSPENRVAVGDILENLQILSASFADRSAKIESIIDDVERTSLEVRQAAARANSVLEGLTEQIDILVEGADTTMAVARGTMSGVDQVLDQDIKLFLADARATAHSFAQAGTELDSLLQDNSETITGFMGEGLYEFTRMITEMRLMVTNFSRLTSRIESDPAQFLFGDSQHGYKAK